MHASQVTPEAVRMANELYWGSDRSVNQIADELDLSKGALYGAITPQPSGLFCPMCADEVAYPNRTAKERDLLQCPTCEWEGSSEESVEDVGAGLPLPADEPEADEADDDRADHEVAGAPRRLGRDREAAAALAETDDGEDRLTPLLTPWSRTVLGGALVGAAVGLALVMWARRR